MSGPAVQVFDLTDQPHQLARDEWTPHVVREPGDLRGVVLHAWGVRSVGTMGSMRARHGEPLALARRGLAVPYSISCGVTAHGGVPVVSVAHPLERYTYASDAGNANFLAIGVMGLFAFEAKDHDPRRHTEVTPALAAALDRALQVAAEILDDAGAREPLLVTHRQCVNGPRDHVACPGEAVVAMALSCPSVGLYTPRPDLVLQREHGRPWPDAWRRHLRPEPQAALPLVDSRIDVREEVPLL